MEQENLKKTTIQISKKLRQTLKSKRFEPRESYENIIWRLIKLAEKYRELKYGK